MGLELIANDLALCDIKGRMSLAEVIDRATSAIAMAREENISRLVLDVSEATGFDSPGVGERYFFIRRWAGEAAGRVQVAVVAQARMLDPDRFGVTVATNIGFRASAFSRRDEAVAWLSGA